MRQRYLLAPTILNLPILWSKLFIGLDKFSSNGYIVHMPAKIVPTEEQIKKVKELFDLGYGARKIAKELLVTRDHVQKICKLLGLNTADRTCPRRNHLLTEKVCKTCKILKPINDFRCRQKESLIGGIIISIEPYCKDCEKDRNKERYYNDVELTRKIARERNKTRRDHINEYERNRTYSDPAFKLRKKVSAQIRQALKKNLSSKGNISFLNFITYSLEDLKLYLESLFEPWMSWENYGRYTKSTWNENDQSTWKWSLDHITPQTHLPYTSMEDDNFKICWALENLRPYDAKNNIEEGNNRSQEEIAKIKEEIRIKRLRK